MLTLAVEVPLYLAVLSHTRLLRRGPAALAAVAVNLATHPLVWLALRHAEPYWPAFAVVEVAAWLTEFALLYFLVRREPALLAAAALTANTLSALAGLGLT